MHVRTTADYDVEAEWIQIGPSSWLPARFTVLRSIGPRRVVPDVVIAVHVELVDPSVAAGVTLYDGAWPTPVARTVSVSRTYGEVLEKDVRDVPVVQLVEDGTAALRRSNMTESSPGKELERGGRLIRRLDAPPSPAAATRELRSARQVLGRARVDLGLVAHAHEEATKAGRKDTTIAVAQRLGLSRSRAAHYVREARRAGLLPPLPTREERSDDV